MNQPVPDGFLRIKIERVFYNSLYIPYIVSCTECIKKGGDNFSTLKEVKDYYGITKLTKLPEKGWAIAGNGTRKEWNEYEALISTQFIKH